VILAAFDDVTGDKGVTRAVDIDTIEIAEQAVAFDARANSLFAKLDARINLFMRRA
jgi:hypothetical protein